MSESSIAKAKILVVDDVPANLVAMRHVLKGVDAEIVTAGSGNQALALCLNERFAVILLDVQMPEMDGFEVAELLSEEESTRDTPVIFVTAAYSDDMNRLKGYRAGAVDYIAKPINDTILLSKVKVFLELHKRDQLLRQLLSQLDQRNKDLQSEIAERQRAELAARHQATHDPLTGIPNRMLFIDRVETAIERASRRGTPFALGYIDIDGFKPVNDKHGHHVGDLLLKAIAGRLSTSMRREDTVARLGGDEFAFIMEESGEPAEQAMSSANKICEILRAPYHLVDAASEVDLVVDVGASLGLAMFPVHGKKREALLRAADHAMYTAKRGGKNRCVLAE
jgi:diguanylate cyclase (GGDEF)-like protein